MSVSQTWPVSYCYIDDMLQEMTDSVSQSETDLADMEDQLERLEEALNMKTTELEQVKTRERGREETLHLTTGVSFI